MKYTVDYKNTDNSREIVRSSKKLLRDYSEKMSINKIHIKNNFNAYTSKTSKLISPNETQPVKLPNVFSLTSVARLSTKNSTMVKKQQRDNSPNYQMLGKIKSSQNFNNQRKINDISFRSNSLTKMGILAQTNSVPKKVFPRIEDIYSSLRSDKGLKTFTKPEIYKSSNGFVDNRHQRDNNLKPLPKFELIRLPEMTAKVDPKYKTTKDLKLLKTKLKSVYI